jgi:hypothetical protein
MDVIDWLLYDYKKKLYFEGTEKVPFFKNSLKNQLNKGFDLI